MFWSSPHTIAKPRFLLVCLFVLWGFYFLTAFKAGSVIAEMATVEQESLEILKHVIRETIDFKWKTTLKLSPKGKKLILCLGNAIQLPLTPRLCV